MKHLLLVSTLSVFLSVQVVEASAQSIAGTYRCYSYNIDGNGGGCRLTPPLVLSPDGSYKISAENGTWKLKDGAVEFSESKIRGPGRLQSGNRIVFSYDYEGKHHTITYVCMNCAAPKM